MAAIQRLGMKMGPAAFLEPFLLFLSERLSVPRYAKAVKNKGRLKGIKFEFVPMLTFEVLVVGTPHSRLL